MILQCPSCNARFLVADALIPPAGRTVRCGACANQWFTQPAPAAPAATSETASESTAPAPAPAAAEPATVDFATLAETAATSPEAAAPKLDEAAARKLPVVPKQRIPRWPFVTAACALAASWAAVAFFTYFPHWQDIPGVGKLYGTVGAVNTDGLAFESVSLERVQNGSRTQFIIAGSVANQSAELRELPKVRVELKDKEGTVVWSRTYPVRHTIKPGEVYPFRIEDVQTSFADKVATVVVDLGHSLELAVR